MNWADFFAMDGRGFFVWMSFGAFLLAIIGEIVMVRLRIGRVQNALREQNLADHMAANPSSTETER